jgi:dynactin 4
MVPEDDDEPATPELKEPSHESTIVEEHFKALKAFYSKQLQEQAQTGTGLDVGGAYAGLSSPSVFSRIMNMYSPGNFSTSRPKGKPSVMREAADESEGLKEVADDSDTIEKLGQLGWGQSKSIETYT